MEKKSFISSLLKGIIVLVIIFSFNLQLMPSDKEDLKVIKRVVKPDKTHFSSKSLKEAKWLKIVITEKNKFNKEDVRIRIYLPFLELILRSSKKCMIKNGGKEIDLKEIIKDLKSITPMEILFLEGNDSTVKIWLE